MVVIARNDSEHEGGDQKALNLNPSSSEDLNGRNRDEITRQVAGNGNDQIAVTILEQSVVLRLPFGETNLLQEDRLIEVSAVEGDVDQEPRRRGTQQVFEVTPFREVDNEGFELLVRARLGQVGLDNVRPAFRTVVDLFLAQSSGLSDAVVAGLQNVG